MSIESYFTSKKQMIVAFFHEFQQSLNQLSIAVQLQIDKQYFDTKNILQNLHPNTIQKQLSLMKNRQPQLLMKVIDSIYAHFKSQVHIPRQSLTNRTQNPLINTPQRTAESSKVNKSRIGQASSRNQKQDRQNISHNKIQKEQILIPSNFQTQQQSSNRKGKIQLMEASKQLSTEVKNNQQKQMYAIPVQLLNKKSQNRVSSSNKLGPQQSHTDRKVRISSSLPKMLTLQNSRSEAQLNRKSKIMVVSKQDQSNFKNNEYLNATPYEKIENPYSKQDLNSDQMKIRRNSTGKPNINGYNLANSRAKQVHFQENQHVCQKLDLKIHESALELLNKVKQKRSPSRRKHTQPSTTGNRQNRIGGYAVMNISKQSIPWGGSRVLTEPRYP